MRALFLMAALTFASPAYAAAPKPPAPPSTPSVAPVQGTQKAAPLRLRNPLMLDDRRRMVPPGRIDPGSYKPMPKNGGGPEIG